MRILPAIVSTIVFAGVALGQQAPLSTDKPANPPISSEKLTIGPAAPEHPITAAQVHEIMQLTGANQLAVQMMRSVMVNLRKTFPPYVPKDVVDDIEASMEKIDFESMAVESYQKHISTEDGAQIIAFYKTPAGRRLSSAMPQITRETQESGAQAGMQTVQEVIQGHLDEIRAAAAKYKTINPDIPKITAPE